MFFLNVLFSERAYCKLDISGILLILNLNHDIAFYRFGNKSLTLNNKKKPFQAKENIFELLTVLILEIS